MASEEFLIKMKKATNKAAEGKIKQKKKKKKNLLNVIKIHNAGITKKQLYEIEILNDIKGGTLRRYLTELENEGKIKFELIPKGHVNIKLYKSIDKRHKPN